MKHNRGIQKLLVCLLLGIVTIVNTVPYQVVVQKEKSNVVSFKSQKQSNGLDVGKAD